VAPPDRRLLKTGEKMNEGAFDIPGALFCGLNRIFSRSMT
jgi:hypothetical protein